MCSGLGCFDLDQVVVERLVAAAVRRQRLGEEHRQHLCRRELALAVLGQASLNPIEQLRPGQQVEKREGVGVAGVVADARLLPAARALARIHLGWLSVWLLIRCHSLQPTIRSGQPPFFPRQNSGLGLSQCHSTLPPKVSTATGPANGTNALVSVSPAG